ncbi:hypothetical protein HHI36_017951, partial [Cryptolaemus montrouzieri]
RAIQSKEDTRRQTKKPSFLNDDELYKAYRMEINEVAKSFEDAYKNEKIDLKCLSQSQYLWKKNSMRNKKMKHNQ